LLFAVVAMSARSDAASISTVYDMDRMLFEPHPMADEYGTRWTAPPTPPPLSPVPLPMAPMPGNSASPAPSASSPGLAPPPLLPALPRGAAPAPVFSLPPADPPGTLSTPAAESAGEVPEMVLSPRLSIDTGGLDVKAVKTASPPPPPEMPAPGN